VTQIDRKARIRAYKETLQPAGVFRVRSSRWGVGSSVMPYQSILGHENDALRSQDGNLWDDNNWISAEWLGPT